MMFVCSIPATVFANNVSASAFSLVDKDTTGNTWDMRFTVGWDNSWFISGAPSATANWDAVWVFAKFRKNTATGWSNWAHCTLLNTGNVVPAGSTMTFAQTGSAYKGAFIYRNAAGTGTVSFANAEIRWDYGTDGVGDSDTVDVKLFFIEMVYIPQGSFYVGDTNNSLTNTFYEGGTTHQLQITSEGAITVANTAGNLYYDADNSYSGDRSGPIPAAFPKGYAAFYIMKYEISQKQYVDFLNTLTSDQASNVQENSYNGSQRDYIKLASNGMYGMDGDNDAGTYGAANYATMNEANDAGWVATDHLTWMDQAAYLDWAALRPFTELEFEKACRGGQAAVNDEYAWGNATLETATTSLSNIATASEVPNQGNLNYSAVTGTDAGFRSGGYSDATSSRQNAGASYYGVLDLSGNMWEHVVTLGNSVGRAFDGAHGDGVLSNIGYANVLTRPGYEGGSVSISAGAGFRGGSWYDPAADSTVAGRGFADLATSLHNTNFSCRGVRTAP